MTAFLYNFAAALAVAFLYMIAGRLHKIHLELGSIRSLLRGALYDREGETSIRDDVRESIHWIKRLRERPERWSEP